MSMAKLVKQRQRRVDLLVPLVGKPAGKVWMLIASELDWTSITVHSDRPSAEAELKHFLEFLEEHDADGVLRPYSTERVERLILEARRGPIVAYEQVLVEIKVAHVRSLFDRPARKPKRAKIDGN